MRRGQRALPSAKAQPGEFLGHQVGAVQHNQHVPNKASLRLLQAFGQRRVAAITADSASPQLCALRALSSNDPTRLNAEPAFFAKNLLCTFKVVFNLLPKKDSRAGYRGLGQPARN